MSNTGKPSIEGFIEDKPAEKEKRDRRSWVGFVESDVVNFMCLNELEKMTIDDGTGNKAKLTRRKDGSVMVECTSSNIL